MEVLKIIGLFLGSIIILFILTKIMGQREMSQLSIFDYFITITIGSIAAEMSTSLFKENFKKAKIDLNEFLVQCRTSGFFDLSDLKTALLEENGKISFLPYSDKRPTNPSDFNIKPKENGVVTNLILDGRVMEENLNELGFDKLWLNEMLQKQGIIKIDNFFLATYNSDGNLSAYLTNNTKNN